MSFGIYAVGYLILIAGVAYLAHLMHIPQHYIVAIAVIMLGVGVVRVCRPPDIRIQAKSLVLSPGQISSMAMRRLSPSLVSI
jgi:hypothetical protein